MDAIFLSNNTSQNVNVSSGGKYLLGFSSITYWRSISSQIVVMNKQPRNQKAVLRIVSLPRQDWLQAFFSLTNFDWLALAVLFSPSLLLSSIRENNFFCSKLRPFGVRVWRIGLLGTLRKTRRQRQKQRERHQTKGLMSKTVAVHVRYNSWYISLSSSAKQQREMTKFCVVRPNTTNSVAEASILYIPWKG